nr:VOC family protein [Streptomyces sp. IB201691-2A2]
MPLALHHIVIDARDLPGLARFWAGALGWQILSEREREVVIGPDETAPVGICFMPVTDRKVVKNRLHLDLTSAAEDREAEIERILAFGARRIRLAHPQPVPDRHPSWTGHHERRRQLPQPTHPFTPTWPKIPDTAPNEHQPQKSPIRPTNSRSRPDVESPEHTARQSEDAIRQTTGPSPGAYKVNAAAGVRITKIVWRGEC